MKLINELLLLYVHFDDIEDVTKKYNVQCTMYNVQYIYEVVCSII